MTPGGRRPVLVVPYGYRSVPLLQLAAAAGARCDVVWLVRSDDPEIVAGGRLLRRLGAVVDVAGRDGAAVAAAVADHRPDGVVAFRDEDLVPMADLAERLGLAFHRPAVAERLADKVAQRRALGARHLPVPRVWELPAERDRPTTTALASRMSYPVVLKPRRGSGSRHTFLAQEPAELVAAVAWLDGEPDGAEAMVAEEYLASRPGADRQRFADYVSVETLAVDGCLHHVAVTGRLHQAPSFRETGFFIPSALGADERAGVLAAATAALEALDVRTGCVHTEIKLTPDGPRVIEVNGRMGGGVPDMLAVAAGEDLLGSYLDAALGRPVDLDGLVACDRIGFRLFLQPPPSARRVRAIGGLDALAALPGVASVGVHVPPGDPVDPRQGTRAFVLALVGSAADHGEVVAIDRRMYQLADVRYDHEDGSNGVTPVTPRHEEAVA